MDELRLFTAVSPPPAIADTIAGVQSRLESAVGSRALRAIRRENYHVTLEFLGNTPASLVAPVVEAMQAAASAAPGRLELRLADLDAFPASRRPRTLWVGIHDVGGGLATLESELRARLVRLGIDLDVKKFRPHVTIAYVRRQATPADRARIAEEIEDAQTGGHRGVGSSGPGVPTGEMSNGPSFTVSELLLIRSITGPGGSRYSRLHAVRLG